VRRADMQGLHQGGAGDSRIAKHLPVIRRARGYRLYDLQGRRYLDLWQNGGRSLLGHRSGRLTTVLKSTISKGLIADLPSVYSGRLRRVLAGMFPGYKDFRLFKSEDSALKLVSEYLGREVRREDIADPLLRSEGRGGRDVSLWRPFCTEKKVSKKQQPKVLFPLLPFGLAGAPVVVCFREKVAERFPDSQIISAVVLAGALRCLHDLSSHEPPEYRDALKGCREWRREGIYLIPEFDLQRYEQVFFGFLEGGVLLCPQVPYISILPSGELSSGEWGKMIGLFRRFPGK